MRMTFLDADASPKQIKFFIKTHQEGSTKSSGSKEVANLKEIFIYKLLEISGFGPKVHFYGDNFSLFLVIATQDLEFTKRANVNKTFQTYEDLQDSLQLNNSEVIFQFYLFDILARIFVLYDVTTNSGNFGRVTVQTETQQYFKWKIVDFRVPPSDGCIMPEIFEGFLNGNGMFNYTKDFYTICCDRPAEEKLKTGREVISLLNSGLPQRSHSHAKPSLLSAINQAQIFAENFSLSNPLLKKQQPNLQKYVLDVKKNLAVFIEKRSQ